MIRRNRNGARHFLMRLGLGFVMCWFAVQELRTPSDWTVFVPSFVTDASPVAVDQLILLHGLLLLLAATSLVLGVFYLPGCLLASVWCWRSSLVSGGTTGSTILSFVTSVSSRSP